MFNSRITESDAFINLPLGAQVLYFHLCMHADDDGFVDNLKTMIAITNTSIEDFEALCDKGYMIKLDDNINVITHWKVHNYMAKDRYRPSMYVKYKEMLELDAGKAYYKKS